MRRQIPQARKRLLSRLRRVVGVHADGGINERIPFGEADGDLQIGGSIRRADGQQARDTGRQGAFDCLLAIFVKLGIVQMAVRIDQRHFRRAPTGISSWKPARTGLPSPTEAATIIPLDSMPFSFRGWRLATITTLRLMRSAGPYASAMPATMVRGCGSPISTVICMSFVEPFTV